MYIYYIYFFYDALSCFYFYFTRVYIPVPRHVDHVRGIRPAAARAAQLANSINSIFTVCIDCNRNSVLITRDRLCEKNLNVRRIPPRPTPPSSATVPACGVPCFSCRYDKTILAQAAEQGRSDSTNCKKVDSCIVPFNAIQAT